MAWTKTKTAIVTGAIALLVVAATITTLVYLAHRLKPKPTERLDAMPADWSVADGRPEQWSCSDGTIYGHSDRGDSVYLSDKQYGDVTMSAIVGTTNRQAGLALRMNGGGQGYIAMFIPGKTAWADSRKGGGRVVLYKRTGSQQVTLKSYKGKLVDDAGQSAKMTFSAKGQSLEIRLNEQVVLQVNDPDFDSGSVGLRVYGDPDQPCDATFSDVTFR